MYGEYSAGVDVGFWCVFCLVIAVLDLIRLCCVRAAAGGASQRSRRRRDGAGGEDSARTCMRLCAIYRRNVRNIINALFFTKFYIDTGQKGL